MRRRKKKKKKDTTRIYFTARYTYRLCSTVPMIPRRRSRMKRRLFERFGRLTRMQKKNVIARCVINRFVRLSKENKEKYNFTLQREKEKKGGSQSPLSSPLLLDIPKKKKKLSKTSSQSPPPWTSYTPETASTTPHPPLSTANNPPTPPSET